MSLRKTDKTKPGGLDGTERINIESRKGNESNEWDIYDVSLQDIANLAPPPAATAATEIENTAANRAFGFGDGSLSSTIFDYAGTTYHFGIPASNSIAIGTPSSNTLSSKATLVGIQAGNTIGGGYGDTLLGYRAGQYSNNRTLGGYNVIIGSESGYGVTDGAFNVLIGNQCGADVTLNDHNILIGNRCGYSSVTTADYNLLIGSTSSNLALDEHIIRGIMDGDGVQANQSLWFNAQQISMGFLPTSDPGVAGQLWNSSGTLRISAG